MKINPQKSMMISIGQSIQEKTHTEHSLKVFNHSMMERLKSLGFILNPNNYLSHDWNWLIKKVEKRIKTQYNKWLSKARRLVLINSMNEVIPIY